MQGETYTLSVVGISSIRVAVAITISKTMAVVATVQQVGVGLGLRLSISTPLSVVAIEPMAIVATVDVAESMAVVATVQEVGVGLGLRCGLSLPLAVVGKGGDNGGELLHDGLTNGVGDDSAGANGQGSLAGIVNLGVEGGGTKDGGNLMDSSLQVTVVTGNGLVASNGNRDGSVGSNNIGLTVGVMVL